MSHGNRSYQEWLQPGSDPTVGHSHLPPHRKTLHEQRKFLDLGTSAVSKEGRVPREMAS